MQLASLIPLLAKFNVPDIFAAVSLLAQASSDPSVGQALIAMSTATQALEWLLIGQAAYLISERRVSEGVHYWLKRCYLRLPCHWRSSAWYWQ
jgi:hypothetical protein